MSKSVCVRSVFSLLHCSPNRLYLKLALARVKEGARRGTYREYLVCVLYCSIVKHKKICIAKIWIHREDSKLIFSGRAEFTWRFPGCVGVSVGVLLRQNFAREICTPGLGQRAVELLTWPADCWCEHEQNFCGVTKHEAIQYPERISQ